MRPGVGHAPPHLLEVRPPSLAATLLKEASARNRALQPLCKESKMKNVLRISLALALAVLARTASAQTATMTLNVQANVAKACSITWASGAGASATLNIGAYDPTSGTDTASAAAQTLNVRCNKNTTVTIAVDNGTHASGGAKRMVGATFGDFLTYGLYSSLGPPAVAVPASQTYLTTSSATTRGFDFWGVITAGQDVSQDAYSDAVTINLSW
jgi:spore coat protein U-like protein